MNNTLAEIGDLLVRKDNILLTGHVSPDGDCIGSVLGLGLALESLNKNVFMVMQDTIPEMYQFLSGTEKLVAPGKLGQPPELVVFLDCTDFSRAGETWFQELAVHIPVINIDHHISNLCFGTYNLVDSSAAATAEIICRLLKNMKIPLSVPVATALYTGIVMDTGSFQYQNTSPETLRMAAMLLEHGVELGEIREKLFESRSLISLQVVSLALENLKISRDGKIAWTILDQETLTRIGARSEHCEGVVNYPLSIKGVKIGLFFREMNNGIVKVGLRCRSGYDVSRIAANFNGGGHKLAAGCQVNGPLVKAVKIVLELTQIVMEDCEQ